ncbi:MAG: peptidase [Hyphomonadaceae bacterium]|nr:peptidase [Hyphomonadaceae bacterium]MBX3511150.1 peptidase [Hyphomonadaceae bacterium]
MTYCLALKVREGVVLLSDTRTNAGLDDISRFRKMFVWERRGDRAIVLLTAGNLGVTQGVVTRLEDAIDAAARDEDGAESILSCATMYRAAELVGEAMNALQARDRARIEAHGSAADASIIMAGQRKGGKVRLFLIYSAGNFIEATDDTPFLQIGEHKYGKPILDRVIAPATPLKDALKAALISMDSTMRSNLSVGMPLDLAVLSTDALTVQSRRLEADDPNFRAISDAWSNELREAFHALPDVPLR